MIQMFNLCGKIRPNGWLVYVSDRKFNRFIEAVMIYHYLAASWGIPENLLTATWYGIPFFDKLGRVMEFTSS